MSDSTGKSLFKVLWERRVPQFLATYVGVCFGMLQFLIFACDRYKLNDSLIDKFLLFTVLILPAVLLYIYNHGRPGKDSWTKLEKAVVPSNLILALVAAFLIGDSSDGSAAVPSAIEITTDEGEQITRFVPVASQTRQLLVFPFDLKEGTEDWARYAVPVLLSTDMEQDMRIFTRSLVSLRYQFASFDYNISDKVPFSTKLQIANKTKVDYFVEGSLEKKDDLWIADLEVYETGSGELFQEKTIQNTNLYELVDAISQELSSELFLKDNKTDFNEFVDLPASDLITANEKALSLYVQGILALRFNDAYQEALPLLQEAAKLDDKSAKIKVALSSAYGSLGDTENSKKTISSALNLSKQLPERQQFGIKQNFYGVNQELDKLLQLMENWVKLYPQDYEPHNNLIDFYKKTYQLSKAKEIGLLAIKNGHKSRVLTEMADLSIQLEELDDAEKYISEYHKEYPELAKDDTRLADVYSKKGEFAKAIEFYNNHLLNDPQNSSLYQGLAEVHNLNGDHKSAESSYSKALEYASIAQDSATVYFYLLYYHSTYGHRDEFLTVADQRVNCMRKFMPEVSVASSQMQIANFYNKVGAKDVYRAYFENFGKEQPQMKPIFDCLHNFILSLYGEDLETLKKYNQGECKAMVLQGTPDMEYLINGFQLSLEGKHQQAIDNFNIFIKKSGSGGKEFGYLLAKEYRLMGQIEEAIESCQEYLKTNPNNTEFLFELALAQKEKNDIEGGKKTYALLSKLWKDADPQFIHYQKFQELGRIF